MRLPHLLLLLLCGLGLPSSVMRGQTPPANKPPAPPPDVLTLKDGEKLIGHLVRATDSAAVFKSDLLGELTIDWSKVQELHASGTYAVLKKDVKLGKHANLSSVPHGSLDIANQSMTVHGPTGAPQSIPLAQSAQVLDEDTFAKDVEHNPGFTEGWNGAVTAGAAIVQATQQSRAFSGAVNLIRAIPLGSFLPPHDRTLVSFAASEGFVTEPGTPKIKTEIVHASVERDEYFSGSNVYGFGQAIWDHNYSQGLDLQQNYGGGIGWTAIKKADETLDFKGSASYVKQDFQSHGFDHNLIASTFSESLLRKLPRGMLFLQQFSFTPAWNEMHAWLATGGASFNAPVFKRLSFNISLLDNFLNDPPPTFKKNSLQATTGLTYTLR